MNTIVPETYRGLKDAISFLGGGLQPQHKVNSKKYEVIFSLKHIFFQRVVGCIGGPLPISLERVTGFNERVPSFKICQ